MQTSDTLTTSVETETVKSQGEEESTDTTPSVPRLQALERRFRLVDEKYGRGLTMQEFRQLMTRVMQGRIGERKLDERFCKIDAECRGVIDWDGFVSYLLCSYIEQDRVLKEGVVCPMSEVAQHAPDVTRYIPLHDSIIQLGYHPTTVKSDHNLFRPIPGERSGKYVSATSEGLVSFWTVQLQHIKTFRVEPPAERYTSVWVIDVLCMYNVNMLAVATTAPSILFYDIAAFGFKHALTIEGLTTCATCLDYWVDPKRANHALLIWGDLGGSIYGIEFKDCPTMCVLQPTLLGRAYQSRLLFDDIMCGAVCGTVGYRLKRVHQFMVLRVRYITELGLVMSCCRAGKTALFMGDLRGERATHFPVARGIFAFDYCVALQLIIGGGKDTMLRVWNPQKPSKPVMFFQQHKTAILYVIAHRYREQVISISYDKVVNVFDLNTQECLQTVVRKWTALGPRPLSAMYFNATRDALLVATNQLALFEKTEEELRIAQLTTSPHPIEYLLYNDLFDLVISTGFNGLINVYSVTLGEHMLQFDVAASSTASSRPIDSETAIVTSMVFDTTQRRLATGTSSGAVRIWNFNTGTLLRDVASATTRVNDEGSEIAMIHWPLHKLMVTSVNGEFRIYLDIRQGGLSMNWVYNQNRNVTAVAFHPPAIIASASADGNIVLWNCDSRSTVVRFNASLNAKKRQYLAKRWLALRGKMHVVTLFDSKRRRISRSSAVQNCPTETSKLPSSFQKCINAPNDKQPNAKDSNEQTDSSFKLRIVEGTLLGSSTRSMAPEVVIRVDNVVASAGDVATEYLAEQSNSTKVGLRSTHELLTVGSDGNHPQQMNKIHLPPLNVQLNKSQNSNVMNRQASIGSGTLDEPRSIDNQQASGRHIHFMSAVGTPQMPQSDHRASYLKNSNEEALAKGLTVGASVLKTATDDASYTVLLDKMDTLQPNRSRSISRIKRHQSEEHLLIKPPSTTNMAISPPPVHRVDMNVTEERADTESPEFEHMASRNRLVIDQLLFLEARPLVRQVATLVAVGRCGWLHFWCIYGGHGMLHGQFSGARELDEWVGAVCTDPANAYLLTGDSLGYVRVWDIATYCMGRSVIERTQSDAKEALNADKFFFLLQPNLIARELRILRKHDIPGVKAELGGSCRYPPILNCFRAHLRPITGLQYVEGRDYVVSCSVDASIRLWSVYGQFLGIFGKDTPWVGILPALAGDEKTPSRVQLRMREVTEALHQTAEYTIPDDVRGVASATTLRVLFRGLRVHWRLAKRLLLIWMPMMGAFKSESPTVQHLMSEYQAERAAADEGLLASSVKLVPEKPVSNMPAGSILGKTFKSYRKHQKLPVLPDVKMRYHQCCVYGSLPCQRLAPVEKGVVLPYAILMEQGRRRARVQQEAKDRLQPGKLNMCMRYLSRTKEMMQERKSLFSAKSTKSTATKSTATKSTKSRATESTSTPPLMSQRGRS